MNKHGATTPMAPDCGSKARKRTRCRSELMEIMRRKTEKSYPMFLGPAACLYLFLRHRNGVLRARPPPFSRDHGDSVRLVSSGYPERFAQEALGHNSMAIHRAYARRVQMELPPLSKFERIRTRFAEMSKTVEPVLAQA
jgi:hypothetical protein